MTEAVAARAEIGDASKLLALYAEGSEDAEVAAVKLTLEMIAETASWLEMEDAERAAEMIRRWWIARVREGIGGEEAEEFDQRWSSAFAKSKAKAEPKPEAKGPLTYRELKERIAGEAERSAKAKAELAAEAKAKLEADKKISPESQPSIEGDPTTFADAEPKPEAKPKGALVPAQPMRAPLGFQHSKSPAGIPASLENAITAITSLNLDCRYDVFHDRIIVKGHESNVSGDALENLENVTLKLRQAILERFYFDPGAQFTFDALKLRCLDHVFDPVRDYLDGLKWDGRPRLDRWLVAYCKAEDTELNRAIGRKMLVAAVRRVRSPGCKFDYVVVFEGAQGVGKSTLLKTLAGEENFSDNEILGLDKREQQEAVQGVWIYEVAELDGLHKSDVTKVKLFASKTVDSARPAYGRSRVDRPRRGIFVATTNEDTYLRDTTGNRRFWPVEVGAIDLSAVTRDRDQIWAEAAEVEAQGEGLVIPEALWPDAAAQQQARMELDPWEDVLATKLTRLQEKQTKIDGAFMLAADGSGNPEWRVSTDYLLATVLSLSKERQTNNHTKRLAGIMRSLGWARPESPIRLGKVVCRGFTRRAEG